MPVTCCCCVLTTACCSYLLLLTVAGYCCWCSNLLLPGNCYAAARCYCHVSVTGYVRSRALTRWSCLSTFSLVISVFCFTYASAGVPASTSVPSTYLEQVGAPLLCCESAVRAQHRPRAGWCNSSLFCNACPAHAAPSCNTLSNS